jgi:hypothetical protein
MNCRISGSIHPVGITDESAAGFRALLLLRFELLDECGEMRLDWNREGVVLFLEALPDRGEPSVSVARGIHLDQRGLANGVPTNPVVVPVRCGREMAHGGAPIVRLPFRAH